MSKRYEAAMRIQRLCERKQFTRTFRVERGELRNARQELDALIAKPHATAEDAARFVQLQERISSLEVTR